MRTVLVTGAAGFIGFHLSLLLLQEGYRVVGYDGMTDYYDVKLKEQRHAELLKHNAYSGEIAMLEDFDRLQAVCDLHKPDIIVHLAAQAGVRYSLEQPRSYIESNILGTFNVMECARALSVDHLLMASTSSVYGANTKMPYAETDKADQPMTIYAAAKKANEAMGHSYAHLYNLPTTLFRFFTVYGPWGRPDMAPFKFIKGILDGTPIDIYNQGNMYRDFTYVDDLVRGIQLLINAVPERPASPDDIVAGDSLSSVAPHRIVNIGNASKIKLMDFVAAFEKAAGKEAVKNFMEMQQGDVPATWADTSLLKRLTGFEPSTDIEEGVARFVDWYMQHYNNR